MSMSAFAPPLRTPSPHVRIRAASFSFDSPPSRSSTTPLDEPFSKSTGAITTHALARHHGFAPPAQPVLRPLSTKMSDESMSDASSASAGSGASSPMAGVLDVDVDADVHVRRRARAHVDAGLPAGNLLGLFSTTTTTPSLGLGPSPVPSSSSSPYYSSSSQRSDSPASPAVAAGKALKPAQPSIPILVVLALPALRRAPPERCGGRPLVQVTHDAGTIAALEESQRSSRTECPRASLLALGESPRTPVLWAAFSATNRHRSAASYRSSTLRSLSRLHSCSSGF
jgi:hypothetical protein